MPQKHPPVARAGINMRMGPEKQSKGNKVGGAIVMMAEKPDRWPVGCPAVTQLISSHLISPSLLTACVQLQHVSARYCQTPRVNLREASVVVVSV